MIERLAIECMGTRFELVLVGGDRGFLRAAGEEALAEIEGCDARLSRFRSDSVLSHLNRSAALGPVPVDGELFEALVLCEQIWSASSGAFDASIGAWMQHDSSDVRVENERDRAHVGWAAVELQGARKRVAFAHPDLKLDLGAIGKGIALDNAARALADAGVTRALLHGGTSTALALGPPSGKHAWTVSLGPERSAPQAQLVQRALSVSAPRAGSAHVLDPRSPHAQPGLARAAVLAPNATLADAWSTALLVAGDGASIPEDCDWALALPGALQVEWTRWAPGQSPSRSTELEASAS
ncbi:MAG: thiamine biosynthesis lipoprotein [Chlamydiales bacterium]|jgi:thiamine biosynthesis lipoprotein